jgi:hypothetical protein
VGDEEVDELGGGDENRSISVARSSLILGLLIRRGAAFVE